MDIFLLSQTLHKNIVVEWDFWHGMWNAKFKGIAINTLDSRTYGYGLTPEAAVRQYIDKIKGKRIVFEDLTADIPKDLVYDRI